MININRGAENTVAQTVSEKTTITDAYYLFTLVHDQTKLTKSFIGNKISSNIRYDEFIIEENDTEDLVNGIVTLELKGSWSYTIREQASSTNLDPTASGNIVEIGIAKVFDGTEEIPTFTEVTTETPVFNG